MNVRESVVTMPLVLRGRRFLYALVQSRVGSEDAQRRAFILNVLLLGSVVLAALTSLTLVVMKFWLLGQGKPYRGTEPENSLAALLLFLGLYLLSKWRFRALAAHLHISLYVAIAVYAVYRWGIDLPQGLLLFAMIIVMSGILISTRYMLLLTALIAALLITFGYLQSIQTFHPDLYWKQEALGTDDAVVAAATLGLIMAVSWLSSREVEKSLRRARQSEAALREERNLLEIKVEERTREINTMQLEKVLQLSRLADFGRLASGLFHDLIAPLNAISINLEQLRQQRQEVGAGDVTQVKALIDRAIKGTNNIERFVTMARRQIQRQETRELFSPASEIVQMIEILLPKAKEMKVDLTLLPAPPTRLFGSPVKFSQLVTNLIYNAIDAYENVEVAAPHKRQVVVTLQPTPESISLTVQDWASGIPAQYLNKIFDPFFTTKAGEKGTGIGLSICKEIVEEDFGGSITVASTLGEGTVFTVTIPIRR